MLTSNTAIQTALSGLQAYQAAIDTTGENISNANTPGYTRQRVTLAESPTLDVSAVSRNTGQGIDVGTGVSIDGIQRVRDQFLDVQYRQANGQSSYDSQMASQLSNAESALGDTSTSGIGYAIGQFMSAVNSLSSSPSNSSAQAAVVGEAQTLAATMNSVSTQLTTVQSDAGTKLSQYLSSTGQVQQDASQIASLNTQIKQLVAAGQTPNTLLDQRDQLVDDLSGLANTTATTDTNGDGGMTVSFAGQTLVDASNAVTLPATSVITKASGGTLGALANLADPASTGAIQSLVTQLDGVAQSVATTVNTALGSTDFFTNSDGTTPITAGKIAVGSDAATTLSGLGSGAGTTLAALAEQSTTLTNAYSTFVGAVGGAAQSANTASTTSTAVSSAVQNQRESVSGVSLDEEMANLITYQQGYQASARVMNTADEMISDLINTVGAGL